MKSFCIIVVICCCFASLLPGESTPQYPPNYFPSDETLALQNSEQGKAMLFSKLELIARGQYPPQDSRPHYPIGGYITLAGDSGDVRFSPALKKIIDSNKDKNVSGIITESFRSLQKLNEPKETYFAYVERGDPNYLIAGYALAALSADPYDPETVQFVNNLQKKIQGTKNHLQTFIDQYSFAKGKVDQYESKESLEARIAMLVSYAPAGYEDPISIWAGRKLFEVSKQDPEGVAQGIFQYEDPLYAKGRLLPGATYQTLRDKLRPFLSSDCLVMLEALEQGKDIAPLVKAHAQKVSEQKMAEDEEKALQQLAQSPPSKAAAVSPQASPKAVSSSIAESDSRWFLILSSMAAVGLVVTGAFVFWKKSS